MIRGFLAAALITAVGCAVEERPSELLPSEALNPPLSLQAYGTPAQGSPYGFIVTGAQPGARVVLLGTNAGIATGQGPCPAVLGGLCLDLVPRPGGLRVLAESLADPTGRAVVGTVLPAQLPPGFYQFQVAAAAGAASNVSAPVEVYIEGAGPCSLDLFEPNDGLADAVAIAGPIAGLSLCDADLADVWEIQVPDGAIVSATAQMTSLDGDLDLELLNADGIVLDGSYTRQTEEQVLWYNLTGAEQTLYLHAFSSIALGIGGVGYTLSHEITVPAVCVDDAFEPDDVAADAHLVVADGLYAGQACLGDSDWYSVEVAAGEQLSLELFEDETDGNVELAVFDGTFAPLTFGGVDEYNLAVTADDTVYVEVRLGSDDAGGGGAAYELSVQRQPVTVCPSDGFEPNDSQSTAVLIAPGLYSDLGACFDSGEDWYAFQVGSGQVIDVFLNFLHEDADVDVDLYNPGGARLARAESANDDESIVYTATSGGTYLVRVFLWGNTHDRGAYVGGALYDLELELR
jgi:hypothetical protein